MLNVYVDIIFHCTHYCIIQHNISLLYFCAPVRLHLSDAIPVIFKSAEHGKRAERVPWQI